MILFFTSYVVCAAYSGFYICAYKCRNNGILVFNAGNDHNGAIIPTKELAERFFPGVPITRALEEHEALFSNRKIREVLGFKEQHNWQQYVKSD